MFNNSVLTNDAGMAPTKLYLVCASKKFSFSFSRSPYRGGGGGGLEYNKRWGCSSRILKLTPKGDQTGRGSRIF